MFVIVGKGESSLDGARKLSKSPRPFAACITSNGTPSKQSSSLRGRVSPALVFVPLFFILFDLFFLCCGLRFLLQLVRLMKAALRLCLRIVNVGSLKHNAILRKRFISSSG